MAELTQGTIVNDRYQLLEYKGRGSFGEVWLAHDNVIGIDVALKIYISLDQRGVDEFKSEYKTTLGLSHPQLLTASFFDVWDSRPYLVMKFCERGSSASLVGKATELEVWQFIHDVAAGLEYLHSQPEPIIHQDIKPDNILVNSDGNFLITDFGISKRVRSTMRKQSKRAVGAGATAYMGPERFGEDPNPVMASDIWSLGVSAYELATGELPFSGLGGGMQRNGAVLPSLPQGWNPNLNDLIQRMIALEPWDRPTAKQIADYTAAVLEGENISYGDWANPPQAAPSKKKLIIGIAAGVIVVIGAVVAILFATGNKVEVKDSGDDLRDEYTHLLAMTENNVNIGSAQNYEALLAARAMMDSLSMMQEDLSSYSDEDEEAYETLKNNLDNKLTEAQKAWAEQGDAQLNVAHEYEYALEPYQTAARLKVTPDVKSALQKIASATGCKGALMIVTSAGVEDNILRIKYDCLSEDAIRGVVLKYTVENASGNKQEAQATVELEPGNNKTLAISLKDDAPSSINHLTLTNSGLTIFNGPVN
ncbi:MAG: serine/threonine protein kinase [Muribaculaceae bacterium]|nr:serine/threonine protein kinase [Muribaculaceae bacterium]